MEEKFKELLKTTEVRKVDFKEKQYRLDNKYLKSEFVKDILCMANAPGRDGHILLGVKSEKGKPREVTGISHHHDSSDLEQIVNGVVAEPIQFEYYPVQVKGKSCALLHIPQSRARPHRPKKAYGVLVRHIFYTRRASGNREASLAEIREMILSSIPMSDMAQHKAKVSQHITDELVDLNVDDREDTLHRMLRSVAARIGFTRYRLIMHPIVASIRICSLVTSTKRKIVCDYAIFMYPWKAGMREILASRYASQSVVVSSSGRKLGATTANRLRNGVLIHISYKGISIKGLVNRSYSSTGYWFANEWSEPWGRVMKWEDMPSHIKVGGLEFKKRVKYEFFLPNVTSKAELRDRLEHLLSWVDNNIG